MKTISERYINLGFILIVLSVISLLAGIIRWTFFIFSAISLFSYIILDKKELRYPNCGAFENLEKLFHAKTYLHYCMNCGERINISK